MPALRPSGVWTPAAISGLLSWVDLLSASRYVLSGSNITSLRGRAGTYASTALVADAATQAPASSDGSVVATIGNSGADLLAGLSCLKLGSNTTMLAPGIPARGTGAWTVIVLVELTAWVGATDYGAIGFFGQRYVASPNTAHWSGGIGQSGNAGAAWGGGVSSPSSTVLVTPVSSGATVEKTNPSVWAARYDGATASLWYDGAQNSSAAIAHNVADTGLGIGRAGGYPCPQGRVYALLWFDRALTQAEIEQVTSYLLRSYHVGYTHVAGDSIAAGVGTTTPSTDAWPAVFQSTLRSTYGYGARINNQAVSGRTTAQVLANLAADITARKSGLFGAREFCLVACGSNDLNTTAGAVPAALATAKSNLGTIVSTLQAAGIVPVVCEVLDRGDWNATASAAAIGPGGLNEWVRNGGAGTTNVLTIQSSLQAGGWGTGSITFSDQVHPDTAGAAVIGAFVAGQLAAMFA